MKVWVKSYPALFQSLFKEIMFYWNIVFCKSKTKNFNRLDKKNSFKNLDFKLFKQNPCTTDYPFLGNNRFPMSISKLPIGHDTPNPRRFDVNITSICQRPNFDEFPRHFQEHFRCNFADRKLHVVSKYFFWSNFAGRKIDFVSTYLFRRNFTGKKIHVVSTMECISMFLLIFFDVFVS